MAKIKYVEKWEEVGISLTGMIRIEEILDRTFVPESVLLNLCIDVYNTGAHKMRKSMQDEVRQDLDALYALAGRTTY